jgi:hypothetical protein
MLKNKTFSILAIVAALGIAGVTTTAAFYQTAVADKGGQPDDSATTGPACDNAAERHDRFLDNDGRNPGSSQSHTSVFHNDRGLEHSFFSGC